MKVVITGANGQLGSLMVDYLLESTDFEIYGVVRRLSEPNYPNLSHIKSERFHMLEADITDYSSMEKIIRNACPDFFINFAASSFVGKSWAAPMNYININFLGVAYQLEALKEYAPNCRYFNCGSSEEWEMSSPYAVSKSSARSLISVYRKAYNMFAIQGTLANGEGTRRGSEFLTRKVSKAVAKIKKSFEENKPIDKLKVGNIDSFKNWSDGEDFITGIWAMLNQKEPKEYTLCSDETHSVREFIEKAFETVGIKGFWAGNGLEEKFLTLDGSIPLVEINEEFYRPSVQEKNGDSKPAREELGWRPKTSFNQLVEKMIRRDLELLG